MKWLQKVENLLWFSVATPKVNKQGERIKVENHEAYYFKEILKGDVELEMVAIPSGTFVMGSPESESEYDDERPQHYVTVPPFFIGKYPVTQAQWKVIASQTELKVNIDLDEDPSNFKGDKHPVEQVSWYEAVEFCQRLSKEASQKVWGDSPKVRGQR
ncbi:formylglycine-generating enzyme family protein [Crocosphaera sp.]|uniref:formylglycine-generating enzyme family protein n=1 Tax=Crocosphaera sp. TaxID=2729996 RepID=UPI00257AE5DF|nr:formylglycine-generating enzyme family protein [Crocosphaera sp.]NQZ64006.1 formylglycine-generating enzyme family protein [Crocosphaera sp.]